MTQQDIDDISATITNFYSLAKDRYGLEGWQRPVFRFGITGTTAGMAYLGENFIKLNRYIFEKQKADFIKRTLPHEVAHLAAFRVFRDRGHGEGWKKVMRDFGLEPIRCHNYDVGGLKQTRTKFTYACACQKHEVGSAIHRRVSIGVKYECKKCKTAIKFVG
jgi:SprT protein